VLYKQISSAALQAAENREVNECKRVGLFQSLARFLDFAPVLSNESTGTSLEMTRIEIASNLKSRIIPIVIKCCKGLSLSYNCPQILCFKNFR
jgi:hypothetical protein